LVGILEGIRVLDLTQYQAGPVCTTWLGDLGADVIKIEAPWGDPFRATWMAKGMSVYFMAVNRNKKSICLNLRDERGLKIFKELVKHSDVVVNNYAPGTMERLGIGYKTLKEINPQIIFASISGFGQYGPYRERLSFDIIAQAMSGYMTITAQSATATTGVTDIPPVLVTDAIGDTFPGTVCALAIIAALYHRQRTGVGQEIDVSQLDSMVYLLSPSLVSYMLVGSTIPELRMKAPPGAYGLYKAKDRYVAIGAAPALMDRLAEVIGLKSVDAEKVKEWVKDKTAAEIEKLLVEGRVPVGIVREANEVLECPQILARDMVVEVEHPQYGKIKLIGFPIKLSETPGKIEIPPPSVGQHTEEVFSTILGYSREEVAKLREDGVVK